MGVENGDLDAHDIALRDLDPDLLLGQGHGEVELLLAHAGGGEHEVAAGTADALLDLAAQGEVFPHEVEKPAHELVALILEELMAAPGGGELAAQAGELHPGWNDLFSGHAAHPL